MRFVTDSVSAPMSRTTNGVRSWLSGAKYTSSKSSQRQRDATCGGGRGASGFRSGMRVVNGRRGGADRGRRLCSEPVDQHLDAVHGHESGDLRRIRAHRVRQRLEHDDHPVLVRVPARAQPISADTGGTPQLRASAPALSPPCGTVHGSDNGRDGAQPLYIHNYIACSGQHGAVRCRGSGRKRGGRRAASGGSRASCRGRCRRLSG
jgi:hypothetical protein